MAASGTLKAVWAALTGNILVAGAKFVAAAVTGSAAMQVLSDDVLTGG